MSKDNDQLIPAVPGTDVGGHDTAGVDGKPRTERSGDILGTPDTEEGRFTEAHREQEAKKADFVTREVDRTNREVLPKLGGETAPEKWEEEEGGEPEFLADAETSERKTERKAAETTPARALTPGLRAAPSAPARGVTTADVAGTRAGTPPVSRTVTTDKK